MKKESLIIGIDTGGTFTDVSVLKSNGEVVINKAPSTPHDFSIGVTDSLSRVAQDMNMSLKEFLQQTKYFKHGTTVATNALITRRGSKVGFITTKGFEDTTLIMRAIGRVDGLSEQELKHMTYVTKPEPFVPRDCIVGVSERVDFEGNVVVPLNVTETAEAVRYLVEEKKVEAIAISLLFGWANSIHEKKVLEVIKSNYSEKGLFVTVAHEHCPLIGEYARANTVTLNCFLGHTMQNYIDNLNKKLDKHGFTGTFMVMQANGGIVNKEQMTPIGNLHSGPAGGVVGTAYMANLLGNQNVISTDMGGTSFDVGLLTNGYWQLAREPIVERNRILEPIIDIESIGAGGGTISKVDKQTKRLLVGPDSAGANPGPVCYDMGGEQVTVTDADVILGIVDPEYFLGGRKKLNKTKAEQVMLDQIGNPLGMSAVEAAAGIYDVINSKMADLIRKQVVRTGHIPEEYVIYSFGGAGPVHAAEYGSQLGIKNIYIFPSSAVFSAFGVSSADVIHTKAATYLAYMPVSPDKLNNIFETIEAELQEIMYREGFVSEEVEFRRSCFMRYKRQTNEVEVPIINKSYKEKDVLEIQEQFNQVYEDLYGAASGYKEAGSEIVSITVNAIGKTLKPSLKIIEVDEIAGEESVVQACKGTRQVYFTKPDPGFVETTIYDYEKLLPGAKLNGPCIIETPFTTVVVPTKDGAAIDKYKNIILDIN